jgi:hypothetical protein
MWLYIIGGIIVLVVAAVYFFIRRGLNKIKPDPLKGRPQKEYYTVSHVTNASTS